MRKPENKLTYKCKIDLYAGHLGVGRSTIYNWIKTGKLIEGRHFIRIGRILRFLLDENLIRELHEPCKRKYHKKNSGSIKKVRKIDLTY
jgi:hypothetical protein